MTEYLVYHNGDRSVGILAEQATVEFDEFEDAELNEFLLEHIRQGFEQVWDFETRIEKLENVRQAEEFESSGFQCKARFPVLDDSWLEEAYEDKNGCGLED